MMGGDPVSVQTAHPCTTQRWDRLVFVPIRWFGLRVAFAEWHPPPAVALTAGRLAQEFPQHGVTFL
jgi:hypothetical protein